MCCFKVPGATLNVPSQSSMNPTLRERLIRSEQRFLLAVASNDEESLEVFFQEWSQLARDIENTKAAGPLDDITAHLLSEVSHAIENMTVCMLESGSILQESLAHPISDFIQEIPPIGPSRHTQAIAPYHLIFSNLSSSMAPTILGRQKLLDSYAYCWLMQNVHDPYPNCMQMQIISDVSGASTTQVDLWFQEARDSIGWNKLARDYFAGSVNATVTSARRVFLERDKSFLFDVVFAFTTVKANAEMLFLENPCLQGKNVDMGPALGIRTMGSDQDHHMGSFTGEPILDLEGILVPSQVNRLAPPDPLSDLSDSNESEEEDTTPPPSIVGCKRPLAEDVLTSQVAGLGRPQKRRRCVVMFLPGSSRLKWTAAVGHGVLTGPLLPSKIVLPLYPRQWASHRSKPFLISRRHPSRLFHLFIRCLQHRQCLRLFQPLPFLRKEEIHWKSLWVQYAPVSRYTEAVNEGFHNVFHRRSPNGNAALLSFPERTQYCHSMSVEVVLPNQTNSYSPHCRFSLALMFP